MSTTQTLHPLNGTHLCDYTQPNSSLALTLVDVNVSTLSQGCGKRTKIKKHNSIQVKVRLRMMIIAGELQNI